MKSMAVVREAVFRQVEDGKWEVSLSLSDGRVSTWSGDAAGLEFGWERQQLELPATKGWREFAPGPEVQITAKLKLRDGSQGPSSTDGP